MYRDVSALGQWAVSQGWVVTVDPDGVVRFYDPHGVPVVRCSRTLTDPRRLIDVLSALQRAALPMQQPSTVRRRIHRWTG